MRVSSIKAALLLAGFPRNKKQVLLTLEKEF